MLKSNKREDSSTELLKIKRFKQPLWRREPKARVPSSRVRVKSKKGVLPGTGLSSALVPVSGIYPGTTSYFL